MEHKIYLKDICRLCLNIKDKVTNKVLLEITESQQIKFENVSNIKLPLTPSHPNGICGECSDNLENFHFYRNLLLKKQKQLSELLEGNEVKEIGFEICCVTVKEETDFIDESVAEDNSTEKLVHKPPVNSKCVKPTLAAVDPIKLVHKPPVGSKCVKPTLAAVDPIKLVHKPHVDSKYVKPTSSVINRADPIKIPENQTALKTVPRIKTAPKTIISVADLQNGHLLKNLKPTTRQTYRIPVKKITSPIVPQLIAPRETLKFDRSNPVLVITPQYLKTLEQQRANSMESRSCIIQENNPVEDKEDAEFFGDKTTPELAYTKEWVNCQLCGAGVKDEIDREIHIKLAHPENIKFKTFSGPFQCQKCPRLFKLEQACRIHMRAAHINIKTQLCEKCGRSFKSRDRYYAHVAEHEILKCTVPGCGKFYNGKAKLKKHLETHVESFKRKVLICDKCASRYINKDNLRIHMRKCDGSFYKDHTLIKPKRKQMKLME